MNSPPPTGCLKYTGYLKARFDYDPATLQLTTENLDATFYQGQTLVRSIDSLGRPSGYSLQDVASSALSVVNYTYGSSGRLSTVSDGTDTFTYAYENNSNLLASLTGPQHTTAYTYEPNRNVMTILDNQVSGSSLAKYAYSYDALGRRDDRSQSGSAISTSTDDFSFNSRSEVIALSNSAETTAKWNPTYSFDNIGNRKSSTGFQPVASYSSNNVNQYSAIGSASPIHDLDGNLTSDGGTWTYTWNNENRLTTATSGSARLRFTYDYQGRLVQQLKETENQTTGNWETDDSVVFVYDGWNRIAKYIDSTLDSTYLFGLDLSGSMQGAGGVGGLLKEGDLYPTYDANGNIMQKLDGAGTTVMNVVYDPFGNIISGILVGEYGFSTKPLIDDLDWYYYGFRYYDPVTGRWPSRDPIAERGGLNLYAMVRNNVLNHLDYLGLSSSMHSAIIKGGLYNTDDYASIQYKVIIDSCSDGGSVEITNVEMLKNPLEMGTLGVGINALNSIVSSIGKYFVAPDLIRWKFQLTHSRLSNEKEQCFVNGANVTLQGTKTVKEYEFRLTTEEEAFGLTLFGNKLFHLWSAKTVDKLKVKIEGPCCCEG